MWAAGVDVSTRRIAMAVVGEEGRVYSFSADVDPELRGAVRLAAIRRAVRQVDWLVARRIGGRSSAILVEDARVGPGSNKELIQAVGVTLEALAYENTCPILEIPIGTWKREAVGRGNATKEECWGAAVAVGGRPANQDEADAICVAVAALGRL